MAVQAAEIDKLPIYNENTVAVKNDWLVKKVTQKSAVYKSSNDKELILSNGLLTRRFRIAPNAATVSIKQLVTGEEFLRAVEPEAIMTLDGQTFQIGGLDGQPNNAFLKEEWIDQMKSNPAAFKFTGFETANTKARFAWKKRAEWMSQDMPWPPSGKSLTLNFKATDKILDAQASIQISDMDKNRKFLLADDFSNTVLAGEWKEVLSKNSSRSSFQNEGKPGEIMTLANCYTYAERELPEGVQVVECRVDPGTDTSAGWGPGITTVWPNRTVKFYLRPGQDCFGVSDNTNYKMQGKIKKGQPYYLRQVISSDKVICYASTDKKKWIKIAEISGQFGNPKAVRLGKTSQSGKNDDHSVTGKRIRCRVDNFRAYGKLKKAVNIPTSKLAKLTISVHYEIYDGIPLMCKWLTIRNDSNKSVTLNSFVSEIIAAVEPQSSAPKPTHWKLPNILAICDMNFGGANIDSGNPAVHWETDPAYTSQVNFAKKTPCLLKVYPPIGPEQEIKPGTVFESFRTFELPQDSTDRERKGLAERRLMRTAAPWITENPLMFHIRNAQPEKVKFAIDQCAEVGFDMVILSFGSGFNAENDNPEYLAQIRKLVDYAHKKGVTLGGYSLLASRRVERGSNIVGVKPRFGNSPCLCSKWGIKYFDKIYNLYKTTGLDNFEHDGSYPGDACKSTVHPGHKGYEDSQWNQWVKIRNLYRWMRGNGIYLNVPDFYFLQGSSRTGMGYREVNWSLPRKEQELHERQNIYDGTWTKTGSMGWMHVPLTQYHGGGAAATIEPLKDHLQHYEQRLYNLLSSGVTGVFRGNRLYDTDKTEDMVKKMVDWYRKYKAILDSDIIHLRRADGRDIDYILHVNPNLEEKGMLMVYNPLAESVKKKIRVPLYYTGITASAIVSHEDKDAVKIPLSRDYSIELTVTVPAHSTTWYVIKDM